MFVALNIATNLSIFGCQTHALALEWVALGRFPPQEGSFVKVHDV